MEVSSAGHPILLIVDSSDSNSNKFGAYLGEILRAEGLNAFDQIELSSLTTTAQLSGYDLTILAYTSNPLGSAQASILSAYVSGGGALLAMRPDSQIASLFGLNAGAVTLTDGYLQIKNSARFNGGTPGSGLTSATLQIHGDADQYTTAPGAVALAQLYSDATTLTSHPAVVGANYGSGQAVAFTYDLASNVVYTRQGNPANASLDVDGDSYVRTTDLFETQGGGAPWIDLNKIPIPQADEQQRLFARLVQQLVGRNHPLPQLWYFPGTAKTMLILTSDAHYNDASVDYPAFFSDLNTHQGQATMYLSAEASAAWPSEADLETWQAQGNTFGIHPYIGSGGSDVDLTSGFNTVDSLFSSMYTIPRSNTVRIHRYLWDGWTTAADTEAAHNIALDVSFAPWGAWFEKADGTWPHGYMTGSGLPMKFIRTDGTLSSVYQQLTNLTDDQLFTVEGGFEGLTGSGAVGVSQGLIDASLAGNYSAVTQLHHVDYYDSRSILQTWLTGVVDYARSKSVPVWNADRWLSFTQTRHDANYNNITWTASTGTLSFDIAMTSSPGLTPTTILPLSYGGQALRSVTVDGGTYTYITQTIKSTNVAFVSMPGGNHSVSAVYGSSTKLPQTITVVNHAPATAAYGASFTVAATASSGLSVTYSASGVCTNVGNTFTLTSGTGTCTVQYDQAGNGSYYAAPQVTETVTAQKVAQTITVVNHAPASAAYGASFTVTATASSGLAVAYSASGVCTNVGNTFTLTSASGTCTVQYDQGGNGNYNAATQVTEAVTAQKANQTITVVNHAPASAAYGTSFTVMATASSGLAVTYSASGACTNAGNTFTMTSPTGTCTVQYDQAGNGNYNAAPQVTEAVTAQKAAQTITVMNGAPASAAYGASFTVTATASSGLAVAYSALGACTNVGNTFTLTSGTGTCTVHYDQAGNGNYSAAVQVTETVTAQKAAQTITVVNHAPASAAYSASFTVTATASSGLAVAYSASGACTNVGNTFTLTSGTGTCTVQYNQGGNANYNAAPQVTETVTAQKAAQTITVVNHAPASAAYGASFTVTATASSGLAVAYSASGVCTNIGGTFTLTSGTGTCTVRYDQAGNANYNAATQVTETVTVQKAAQTITVVNHAPASAAYGASFTVTATASSGLPVTYSASGVCTNVGNTFTLTSGTGTCTVQYDQAGNGNYNAATQVTETVTAQKVNQTITVVNHAPASAAYGASFTVTATASSGLAVTYSASGVCTNVGNTFTLTSGTGSCAARYDQAGDANYNAAPQVTETVTAQKANQTITVVNHAPATAAYGASFTVTATASSGLAVTYSASGVCTNVGNTFTLTSGTGTCTVQYNQGGNANYAAALQVAETVTAQKAAQTITFGALRDRATTDASFTLVASASSELAVAFTATGPCSVNGNTVTLTATAGTCTVTAHQSGNSNYDAAPEVSQSFKIAFRIYLPFTMGGGS